ncbi:hypothetical protein Mapa_016453 [Marchantia paleacea]|nr:hypothetical protein Mapa_016453 [Marchantia paleacea]
MRFRYNGQCTTKCVTFSSFYPYVVQHLDDNTSLARSRPCQKRSARQGTPVTFQLRTRHGHRAHLPSRPRQTDSFFLPPTFSLLSSPIGAELQTTVLHIRLPLLLMIFFSTSSALSLWNLTPSSSFAPSQRRRLLWRRSPRRFYARKEKERKKRPEVQSPPPPGLINRQTTTETRIHKIDREIER